MYKTKNRNKHLSPSRSRKSTFQRIQYKTEGLGSERLPTAQDIATFGYNGLYSIKIEAIPYLELFPKELKSGLASQFREMSGPILEDIPIVSEAWDLIAIDKRFSEIAEKTDFQWFVGEVEEMKVPVFYKEYDELSGWLAPRLSFLPKLKRRSERMYATVLNSFRHLTTSFLIGDFRDCNWVTEWAMERLNEGYEEMEKNERAKLARLINSYTGGKADQGLKSVHSAAELSLEECITRLNKLPKDLSPLAEAILNLLKLSKSGKNMSDYDLKYHSGINETNDFDEYYITIDRQYNWIWDYDYFCSMTEEALQDDYNGGGQQPPCTWRILGSGFKKPESIGGFIKELEELTADDFVSQFGKCMEKLCEAINKVYPPKEN